MSAHPHTSRTTREYLILWLERQGISTVILFGLCLVLYWIGKPAVTRLIESHIAYLESSEKTGQELVKAQNASTEALEELVAISKDTKTEIRALDATTRVIGAETAAARDVAVSKLEQRLIEVRDELLSAIRELKRK